MGKIYILLLLCFWFGVFRGEARPLEPEYDNEEKLIGPRSSEDAEADAEPALLLLKHMWQSVQVRLLKGLRYFLMISLFRSSKESKTRRTRRPLARDSRSNSMFCGNSIADKHWGGDSSTPLKILNFINPPMRRLQKMEYSVMPKWTPIFHLRPNPPYYWYWQILQDPRNNVFLLFIFNHQKPIIVAKNLSTQEQSVNWSPSLSLFFFTVNWRLICSKINLWFSYVFCTFFLQKKRIWTNLDWSCSWLYRARTRKYLTSARARMRSDLSTGCRVCELYHPFVSRSGMVTLIFSRGKKLIRE